MESLLFFSIDEQQFALKLDFIVRILRMVEIVPVPELSAQIFGIINVQGTIVPVMNTRRLLGCTDQSKLKQQPLLEDRLILVNIKSQMTALVVDMVLGAWKCPAEDNVFLSAIFPAAEYGKKYVNSVIKVAGKMAFVLDLEQLLANENWEDFDLKSLEQ